MVEERQIQAYLLFGDDDYLRGEAAKRLVARLVPPEQMALGLETIDGTADNADQATQKLDTCMQGLLTVSLLGSGKVIWLRDVNFFSPEPLGKTEAVKAKVSQFTALLKQGLPQGHILILTATRVAKNTIVYKAFRDTGEASEFALPKQGYQAGERQARGQAAEAFRKSGLQAGPRVLEAFVARVGTNTRQVANEAQKLAAYLGERKSVRLDDVREIVSATRESAAWEFAEAVGDKDLWGALAILRRSARQKDMPPIRLVYNLEYKIRELRLYREALRRRWIQPAGHGSRGGATWQVPAEAEKLLAGLGGKDPRGVSPWRCGKLAEQAGKFTPDELDAWHGLILQTHHQFVSSTVPHDLLLELLLFRLMRKTAGREARRALSGGRR